MDDELVIKCPKCGEITSFAEAKIVDYSPKAVAECRKCNAVFDAISNRTDTPVVLIHPPRNITYSEEQSDLVISWRWITWGFIFYAILFLLAVGYVLIKTPIVSVICEKTDSIIAGLILLLILAYSFLTPLFSSTKIHVSPTHLTVRKYPIRFLGEYINLPLSDIENIMYKIHATYGRGASVTYHIDVELKGGKCRTLLSVWDNEQAQYIAQLLGQRLGVPVQDTTKFWKW